MSRLVFVFFDNFLLYSCQRREIFPSPLQWDKLEFNRTKENKRMTHRISSSVFLKLIWRRFTPLFMTNQHINRIEEVTSRFVFFSTQQNELFPIRMYVYTRHLRHHAHMKSTICSRANDDDELKIPLFYMLITYSQFHINMYISWKIKWCNQISICKCYQSIDRWE